MTSRPLPTPVPRDSMWVLTRAIAGMSARRSCSTWLASVVGLVQEEVVVDLEVEVDVDLAVVLVDADVVDRDLVPLGDGPDAPGHVLPLGLARVRVDDHVGARDEGLDPGLDALGDGVGPLEGQVPVDLDGHVDEDPGARAAEADLARR